MISGIRRRAFIGATGAAVISSTAGAQTVEVVGAGTSFMTTRMKLWIRQVQRSITATFIYDGMGDDDGLNKLLSRDADFMTTDQPLTDERLKESNLFQFLIGYGGLAPIVSLPGIASDQLTLTGDLLAGLYTGAIRKWNDPRIAAINAGVQLPDLDVRPFHLGTPNRPMLSITYHFTQYLLATNPDWRAKYGAAITKRWAVGSMVPYMEAMADNIRAVPGGIGYMPSGRAKVENMTTVQLRNAAGRTVAASYEAVAATVTRASAGAPAGTVTSLINPLGDEVWPIVLPSYVVLPRKPRSPAHGAAVSALFKHIMTKGAPVAERMACVHANPEEQASALILLEQTSG